MYTTTIYALVKGWGFGTGGCDVRGQHNGVEMSGGRAARTTQSLFPSQRRGASQCTVLTRWAPDRSISVLYGTQVGSVRAAPSPHVAARLETATPHTG